MALQKLTISPIVLSNGKIIALILNKIV